MTNYEAIRTMDKDELAEFLSSIVDCEAIRIMDKDELAEFLLSIMDVKKCPASEKFCDGQRDCDDAILNKAYAEKLSILMANHPDMRVMAWIDTDGISDDYAYLAGNIYEPHIKMLIIGKDDNMYYRED